MGVKSWAEGPGESTPQPAGVQGPGYDPAMPTSRKGSARRAAQATNPAKRPDEASALGWRIDLYKRVAPSTKRPAIILHLRNAAGVKVGQLFALRERPASGPYTMVSVDAPHGWGPLLYDVAMELSGAAGLAPDRASISKAATQVWVKYAERADVTAHPLPAWMPQWEDPVLDVIYTKRATAVPALRAAGALRARKGHPPRE